MKPYTKSQTPKKDHNDNNKNNNRITLDWAGHFVPKPETSTN